MAAEGRSEGTAGPRKGVSFHVNPPSGSHLQGSALDSLLPGGQEWLRGRGPVRPPSFSDSGFTESLREHK